MAVTAISSLQWVMRTMMKSKGETGMFKLYLTKIIVELNTQLQHNV